MAAKEKVEAEVKVAEVKAADAKVEEIKAKRLADKAKKHEERVAKHPKLGKAINWVDDHKWQVAGGIATLQLAVLALLQAGLATSSSTRRRRRQPLQKQQM